MEKTKVKSARRHVDKGTASTKRGVQGSRVCFTGTRIPVDTLWSFFDAKCSTRYIRQNYPTLTLADVKLSRKLWQLAAEHHSKTRQAVTGAAGKMAWRADLFGEALMVITRLGLEKAVTQERVQRAIHEAGEQRQEKARAIVRKTSQVHEVKER